MTLDPYAEALDEFDRLIESHTGVEQTTRPAWERAKLIIEEAIEADEAIRDTDPYSREPADLAAVAKELADCLYVVFGSARRFRIPILKVFRIVHASNLSKLEEGVRFDREGKLLKSAAYRSPIDEIREVLENAA